MKTIAVIIYPPVVGAKVSLDDVPSADNGITNSSGMCSFLVDDSLTDSQLTIEADGYYTYSTHVHLNSGNQQIRVGMSADPNRTNDIILPGLVKLISLPILRMIGNDFVDSVGKRAPRVGIDSFMLIRQYLDGGRDAVMPFIDEMHEFDFDTCRIFCQGDKNQNQVMDLNPAEPNYYPKTTELVNLLNEEHIVPLLECYIDNQILKMGLDHWTKLDQCTSSLVRLLSGGNEFPKNGFFPAALPFPSEGTIWSRGSNVSDNVTYQFGATAASFHQRRDMPKSMMDAVASVYDMRDKGFTMLWMDEPLGFNEVDEPNRRSNDPDLANQFSTIYRKFWALSIFHNSFSQRGQLMGPRTRECAKAWQAV